MSRTVEELAPRVARRTNFRAACVQACPVIYDVAATLQRVGEWTGQAANAGADLVVFPEAFVSAYPRGSAFGAVVGARSSGGRDEFLRYFQSAIAVPSPEVAALGEVARQYGVHLVIGVIERDGGTLYCSVLFLSPEGKLLGVRRKLMPTGSERLVWGFGDGSTLAVHETELGRIGAVICWENYMPMLRAAMYGQHIEVYCAPTADGRPTWLPTMQHIALEGRCFVLSTNQFNRRKDFPDTFPLQLPEDPEAIVSRGGACIVDPLGNVLAGPLWDTEGVITADIDLDAIPRAMFDFDPVGHYSRPDVFGLTVDTSSRRPVTFVAP